MIRQTGIQLNNQLSELTQYLDNRLETTSEESTNNTTIENFHEISIAGSEELNFLRQSYQIIGPNIQDIIIDIQNAKQKLSKYQNPNINQILQILQSKKCFSEYVFQTLQKFILLIYGCMKNAFHTQKINKQKQSILLKMVKNNNEVTYTQEQIKQFQIQLTNIGTDIITIKQYKDRIKNILRIKTQYLTIYKNIIKQFKKKINSSQKVAIIRNILQNKLINQFDQQMRYYQNIFEAKPKDFLQFHKYQYQLKMLKDQFVKFNKYLIQQLSKDYQYCENLQKQIKDYYQKQHNSQSESKKRIIYNLCFEQALCLRNTQSFQCYLQKWDKSINIFYQNISEQIQIFTYYQPDFVVFMKQLGLHKIQSQIEAHIKSKQVARIFFIQKKRLINLQRRYEDVRRKNNNNNIIRNTIFNNIKNKIQNINTQKRNKQLEKNQRMMELIQKMPQRQYFLNDRHKTQANQIQNTKQYKNLNKKKAKNGFFNKKNNDQIDQSYDQILEIIKVCKNNELNIKNTFSNKLKKSKSSLKQNCKKYQRNLSNVKKCLDSWI